MKQDMQNTAVPAAIVRKLQLVQKRSMFVQIASALVVAATVLLAAMGVAMLIDWLATLYDSRWRFVLTSLAAAAAVATSVGWILVAWRRAHRLERVAAEVDRATPPLEERWTTMTLLGDDAKKPEVVHPAMLRRLSSEAASWEPRIEPEQVVSLSLLMRAMIGLTAVTAVLAIAVIVDPREVSVLARRFWAPGASISATTLVDVPGNLVIPRGEPLALNAAISGRPVQNAVLFLQPHDKAEQTIALVADRSEPVAFSHRLRSVDEPFSYRFRAGDGQTEWFNVDVADRPEIDAIKLTVTPPPYTRQKAKTFDKLPEKLSAMRTSRIEFAVHAKSPVESAQLKMDNNKVLALPLGSDGWYRWTATLGESFSITPVLTETHGLTNRHQPKCQLISYEDQPPVVKVLTPNDRMAVRPDDSIQITFSATDDVGISSAELVVYNEADQKEPTEIAAIPIDLGEQQGARAVQQTVDLDLKKFAAKNGAELSYEIRVREDRGTDPPRIAARPDANKKDPKKQQALAANNMKNGKSAKQSPGGTSPTTPPANSVAAANSAPQSSPSKSQTGEPAPSTPSQSAAKPSQGAASPSQTAANQSPATTPNAEKPAKPDAAALAANDPAKPSQSLANERSQPAGQTPASPSAQQAASNSAANSKDAGTNKTASSPPAAPMTKDPAGPSAPLAASPNPQALATNSKPADTSSSKPQPAANSPAANSSPANASAISPQPQQPANPQQPSVSPPQMAKNDLSKPAASQPQNPSTPEARTASTGRQSLTPNSDPASGRAQSADSQQANASQQPNASQQSSSSQQSKSSQQPSASQQASSSQSANSNPSNSSASMKQNQASDQKPSTDSTAKAGKSDAKADQSMASAKQPQSPSNNSSSIQTSTPPNDQKQTASSESTPEPGNNMPKRMLDVVPPQEASSQRMRLKVDQWAGSFEGQQRAKLEMAIAPELEALDQKLAKAERTARGVLDGLEKDHNWVAAYDRDVATTQQLVVDGKAIIEKLVKQSKDTPYAFIGLQVSDLDVAHLEPARSSLWSALQSKGDDRTASVRDAWQHISRARQLLADLRGQFERSKRDFQLAEAVEKAKKMYQVYVENSQALLQMQDQDPDRYNRKMAEFNLDDEYMKRLKEVIKMRTDLEAELARILGDDPRLLRRFMDNLRARSNNLREQLADLSAKQTGLNREVRAWAALPETERAPMARLLLLQNLQESTKLATEAGELQDRYQSWLPLQNESKDAGLVAVSQQIQQVATAANELRARADQYIATEQQAAAAPVAPATAPAPPAGAGANPTAAAAKPPATADNSQALDQIVAQSEALYGQLGKLEVSLRQLASREDQAEVATFAGNRLVQTRRLIADATAWIRQVKAQKSGSYTGAAEVTQYRLAMKTDELAGKLANLEQQLAGMLQRPDRQLPEPIANKAREFMAALDKEAAPNQLAAVYALHSNQPPRAVERQDLAGNALVKAEKLYDELMKMVIVELDKLPVQDPIASLLDDPTLDELLAQLEQELPLQELLGIPNRPSNLRIIGDWMRPGNNGGGGGGMRQIAMNQMRQNNKRSQDKLKKVYQQAIARALKETTPKRTEKVAKTTKLSDWNKLVSHLGDDLKQGRDKAPPEQYRQAIEQYFAQISRTVAEQEKKSE